MSDATTTQTTAVAGSNTPRQWLFIGTFFVLLWLPLIDSLLHLDRTLPTNENRALAPAPAADAPKEFPRQFSAWYDDRFGFRNFLVKQYHTVHFGWLGITDPDLVVQGKEDWLYLGRRRLIDEARGLNPATEEDIATWVEKLDAIHAWQTQRGGRFLLVLVPDKHRVYPEYLPDWFIPQEQRRKEQLLQALAGHEMETLDLTQILRIMKPAFSHDLWLKTDTHWNGLGAFVATQAITQQLGLPIPSEDDFVQANHPSLHEDAWHKTGNLADFLGVRGLVPEAWVGLVPNAPRAQFHTNFTPPTRNVSGVNVPLASRIENDTLPTGLVLGDSFRWALIPTLSESFSEILYTDFRYCFFDPAFTESLDPDIILFLMTERQLLRLPLPPSENTW